MMTNADNKGLLVVSFGTLHQETCDRTIGPIEGDLAKAFPERQFYSAWTSEFIIRKLKETRGIQRDTVEASLARMENDGITDLLVQPTHLIDGYENQRLADVLREHADQFEIIRVGRPILDSAEDAQELSEVIARDIYSKNVADGATAVILMGHGSTTGGRDANAAYTSLQERLIGLGLPEIVVGTVEGNPTLDDAVKILKEHCGDKIRKAILTPLMIVAGNHAVKDMDGDQEDSWKNILAGEGYEVTSLIKGLGEYWGVRNMMILHAVNAHLLEK